MNIFIILVNFVNVVDESIENFIEFIDLKNFLGI
jgi:hypothetical protein